MARTMLADSMSVEYIAGLTGLTVKEVKALR
jgi:hypothetical protein